MTPNEFRATAIALLRTAVGWQTKIARRLGVEPRTVRRWLHAGRIPDWAEKKLADLIGMSDRTPWPRDEWLIGEATGEDGRRRDYIAHLQPPRFVARIVQTDARGRPEPAEEPADVVSGTVYDCGDGLLICEIAWIDEPAPGEVAQLLDAATDVIDDHF